MNVVAAPCVLSTDGAVHVTVRLVPVPRATIGALSAFGPPVAVVIELVVDHALLPAAFVL